MVQRAVELQGFILDRSSLPWQPINRNAGGPQDRTSRLRFGNSGLEITAESTTPQGPRGGRPGLIVFKTSPTNGPPHPSLPPHPPRLLLAFIVPESPITGIDKAAFIKSLDIIDKYFRGRLTPEQEPDTDGKGQAVLDRDGKAQSRPTGRQVLHIVAPNYDGSQWSLETALGGWASRARSPYHFRVLSNNAGRIDQAHLQGSVAGDKHNLTFRSMVHESSKVAELVRTYLEEEFKYPRDQQAILFESNSGMTQAEASKILRRQSGEDFLFPLQVSEIRKAYVRRGFLATTSSILATRRNDSPSRPMRQGLRMTCRGPSHPPARPPSTRWR